jgi:glycosyltransferase involved in cell wall biosynthesis
MKFGAYLGVKDEVELIVRSIDHLLAIGVDRIFVCDMNSTDGTLEKLRDRQSDGRLTVIQGDDTLPELRDWFEAAREAASRLAALQYDWMLFLDADEFWIPRTGRLFDCLSLQDADIVSVPRYNMPLVRGETSDQIRFDPQGYDRLLAIARSIPDFRDVLRENPGIPWIRGVPGPKIIARPQYVASALMGGHDIVSPDGMIPRRARAQDLFISHLPFSTKERFARKIANVRQMIMRHGETYDPSLAWHWRRWFEIIDQKGIDHEFEINLFDEETRDALRRDGVIVSASDIFRKDFTAAP